MKIKLAYPKIPDTLNCPLKQCVAFEKYDGTNIHWVWKPNMGWLDFGTRRDRFPLNNGGVRQFEQAHPELAGLDQLWDQDPNNSLELYLWDHPRYNTVQEVIVFTEYFGPKSFAGSHDPKDEKQLVIFDVMVDGKVIPPEQMLEDFKKWNLAKVVFQGKFTGQLFVDVRKGKYPVKEGVIVKGVVGNEVYMAKIKTEAYMDKLKTQFKDNWKEYWE
jgi:hypothetical protein